MSNYGVQDRTEERTLIHVTLLLVLMSANTLNDSPLPPHPTPTVRTTAFAAATYSTCCVVFIHWTESPPYPPHTTPPVCTYTATHSFSSSSAVGRLGYQHRWQSPWLQLSSRVLQVLLLSSSLQYVYTRHAYCIGSIQYRALSQECIIMV